MRSSLRVIRTCSDENDRLKNLEMLFQKFTCRSYPINLLNETRDKLLNLDRSILIQPKSDFHIKHIGLHNPEIRLNSPVNILHANQTVNIYFVLPFYKIPRMKIEVKNRIKHILEQCSSAHLRKLALDVNVCFAYNIPDQMHRVTSTIERRKEDKK